MIFSQDNDVVPPPGLNFKPAGIVGDEWFWDMLAVQHNLREKTEWLLSDKIKHEFLTLLSMKTA
jgi:hypothetical protein